MTNKVKMMEKAEVTILEPYADGFGYHEVQVEKRRWKCVKCGLVWNMRHEAQNCKHKSTYQKMYGGYFRNGTRVGGVIRTFSAVRKEDVKTKETNEQAIQRIEKDLADRRKLYAQIDKVTVVVDLTKDEEG